MQIALAPANMIVSVLAMEPCTSSVDPAWIVTLPVPYSFAITSVLGSRTMPPLFTRLPLAVRVASVSVSVMPAAMVSMPPNA